MLGKLKKVPLREVWKNEAYDFSKWLSKAENLKELGDTIGMDIVADETESPVGKFNVDIYGHQEDDEDNKVIIENQLEETDHDHLGKIITYASGKDAKTIIWIVKRVREEHRQAIDWLNAHTDADIDFFLLEIELWQIGNSEPAPKFNVVCKPNDWGRTQKTTSSMTPSQKVHLEFWQGFSEYGASYDKYSAEFNKRKPSTDHWYSIAVGSSDYHIDLLCNTQRNTITVQFYIKDNKEIYDLLYNHKDEIEKATASSYSWKRLDNKKSSYIELSLKVDLTDRDKWNEYYKWLCDNAITTKRIFNKILNKN